MQLKDQGLRQLVHQILYNEVVSAILRIIHRLDLSSKSPLSATQEVTASMPMSQSYSNWKFHCGRKEVPCELSKSKAVKLTAHLPETTALNLQTCVLCLKSTSSTSKYPCTVGTATEVCLRKLSYCLCVLFSSQVVLVSCPSPLSSPDPWVAHSLS